jgi:small subunit ribosomal protein S6
MLNTNSKSVNIQLANTKSFSIGVFHLATKVNVYETMVIFDSNKYAQDPAGVSGALVEGITKLGGEILVSRLWNETKLAYPIKGHRKGTYWLLYYKMNSGEQTKLNREMRINESVLRSLTLVVDDRLVDALVAHASGTSTRPRPQLEAVGVDGGMDE